MADSHTPTPSQLEAITAPLGPVLVLAGPGAGKTFCLIERVKFLVEKGAIAPERICVFTFTNKAAGEIASRLESQLGARVERVKRGTIHSFCAELLREFGTHVGVQPGFGIADEEYQLSVLRRLQGYRRWHRSVISCFSAFRFRGDPLKPDDALLFTRYQQFLAARNKIDFDGLVLKTGQLLAGEMAAQIRERWSAVLVDEFQDLNPVQYQIIRSLAVVHRNVFVVGDDEQSIYSWTGADPMVFRDFERDFAPVSKAQLGENRRCPRQVVELARKLVALNPRIFADRTHADGKPESKFAVKAVTFATEDAEIAWIIDDIRRDRTDYRKTWGDYALLYRKHDIGNTAETGFLTAGIPCRLANKRALAEDPVVCYVIAALRVIANPEDDLHREGFLRVVLPKLLFDNARTQAEERKVGLVQHLEVMARKLPVEHEDRRKSLRSLAALRNLAALAVRHTSISGLVEELLSQRVGEYQTRLEEHHDELSDPALDKDVVRLGETLVAASKSEQSVWVPTLGGVGIALKGILSGVGRLQVTVGGERPHDALVLEFPESSPLGFALGVFKAVQYTRTMGFTNHFLDFTTVDLETTDRDRSRAEIVEIAAVRVRAGREVARYQSLVKPRIPISEGAKRTHHIDEKDLVSEPFFEGVWPEFREFCGNDVLVAHNGYHFDFPILRRMSEGMPGADFVTYDTLLLAREVQAGSARLEDLARLYGIDTGQAHRALADCLTLAGVFVELGEAKVARARKTSLVNLLDYLGIALALSDDDALGVEAKLLRRLSIGHALGRYSDCLEFYRTEREHADDPSLPTVSEVIDRLGGEKLMNRVRAEKTAEQRYPHAMHRLRPLLEQCAGKPLAEQISDFLERVVLSLSDRVERDTARVNLLTLHSTKGLEFSRVYIVGAEDDQLPGQRDASAREIEEARRLLYVGMTRTEDRLVLTRVEAREGKRTGRHRFLDEMGLVPQSPSALSRAATSAG